jgi:hypothetical protein
MEGVLSSATLDYWIADGGPKGGSATGIGNFKREVDTGNVPTYYLQ